MSERKAFESSITAESAEPTSADPGANRAEITRVIRDFVTSTADPAAVAWIRRLTWRVSDWNVAELRVTVTAADGTAAGFSARRGNGPEATVCDVADRFQDFVADNLRVGLPPVPGTARPAVAAVVDGSACWTDAKTGWRCPIGAYPAP